MARTTRPGVDVVQPPEDFDGGLDMSAGLVLERRILLLMDEPVAALDEFVQALVERLVGGDVRSDTPVRISKD